jgi:hypothetical protein
LAVDAMDLLRTRRATGPGAPIGNRYDFNCDGKVAAADVLFVRNKQRRSLGALAALTPAAAPAAAPPVSLDNGRAPRRSAYASDLLASS